MAGVCLAQSVRDSLAVDTTFTDYDELFSELDKLLDSLSAPHSFTLVNFAFGQSYLSFDKKSDQVETSRRFSYSPSVGYYDKSGFGAGAGASIVNDGTGLNPYQFSVTGSYDFQKSKAFIAGLSLTHYVTKSGLPFYTSPLKNEAFAYFMYRKFWLRPMVGFSYGWGSRDAFKEVEEQIQNINLAQRGFTRINSAEKVIDINLVTSVRHDFYFLNAWAGDYMRLTPQLSFISGSHQFGFNQTSNSYAILARTGNPFLYSTDNVAFDNKLYFQPISLTGFLKAEWSKGKFFIQPQFLVDYYFPASPDHLSTAFLVNAGLVF